MYPIQQFSEPLFSGQSLASSVNSPSQDASSVVRLCIQAEWSAGSSLSGTLHFQVSNDNINWNDDPEVTPITISGASGSAVAKVANCSYPWCRLSYVSSAGTGTLTCVVSGKNQ